MDTQKELSFQERLRLARADAFIAKRRANRIEMVSAVKPVSTPKPIAAKPAYVPKPVDPLVAEAAEKKRRIAEQEKKDRQREKAEAAAEDRLLHRPKNSFVPANKREPVFKTIPFSMEGKKTVLVDKANNTTLIVDIDADSEEVVARYQKQLAEKKRLEAPAMVYAYKPAGPKSGAQRDQVPMPSKRALRSTKNNFF